MGGSSGGGASASTESSPWKPQQQYLKQLFSEAQSAYQSGDLSPEYYGGQLVADRDANTQRAIEGQALRAAQGNEGQAAGQDLITSTLRGDYLNSNPYIDAAVQKATGSALAGVNSTFAKSGRYGSGANRASDLDAAGNIASQMYGQNYANERQNQVQAANQALQYANQDYIDLAALAESGQANESYQQALIDAEKERYNYNATAKLRALQNYASLIQGGYGGQATSTNQDGSSSGGWGGAASGALGGAATGAALGSVIPGVGTAIGAGVGAVGGGLMGYFG